MSVEAHLNGGPYDDRYMVVQGWELRVAGMRRFDQLQPADADMRPTIKEGRYAARRDGLGQLVPHNLAGVVEFDFEGWL